MNRENMFMQKYLSITKTTRLAASRDLNDLVEKGIMKRFGSGRGVFYELVVGENKLEENEK